MITLTKILMIVSIGLFMSLIAWGMRQRELAILIAFLALLGCIQTLTPTLWKLQAAYESTKTGIEKTGEKIEKVGDTLENLDKRIKKVEETTEKAINWYDKVVDWIPLWDKREEK